MMRKSSLVQLMAALTLTACVTPKAPAPNQTPAVQIQPNELQRCRTKVTELENFRQDLFYFNIKLYNWIQSCNDISLAKNTPEQALADLAKSDCPQIHPKIESKKAEIREVIVRAQSKAPYTCIESDYDKLTKVAVDIAILRQEIIDMIRIAIYPY